MGFADFFPQYFGVLERLQFGLLICGEKAEGLFAALCSIGFQLPAEGLYFQHGAADGGGIGTAIGEDRLEGLLFGSHLLGQCSIGVGGGAVGGDYGRQLGIGEIQVDLDLRDGRRGAGRGLREANGSGE